MNSHINKFYIFYGTRPELIKVAPIIWELKKNNLRNQCFLVHTGQHLETMDENFLQIKPDLRLNSMKPGQDLSSLTTALLREITGCLQNPGNPKCRGVLVQGDTTSAYAAALAAFYLQIPVFHLEAGMRSGNIDNPFPEEFNRRQISHVARFHFAPSDKERATLESEGIVPEDILVSGNTVIDCLSQCMPTDTVEVKRNTVLITVHRRGNQHELFDAISQKIVALSNQYPNLDFLWLDHPNPLVRSKLEKLKIETNHRIHIQTHLSYQEMLELYPRCAMVITDSGGILEEASYMGIPVIVIRANTERNALYAENHVFECTPDFSELTATFLSALHAKGSKTEIYGSGRAAEMVVQQLCTLEMFQLKAIPLSE